MNATPHQNTIICGMKTILADVLCLPEAMIVNELALLDGTVQFDSLSIMRVIVEIEGHFGIELDYELLSEDTFASVGTLNQHVEKIVSWHSAAKSKAG